jgi:hypothetical protein
MGREIGASRAFAATATTAFTQVTVTWGRSGRKLSIAYVPIWEALSSHPFSWLGGAPDHRAFDLFDDLVGCVDQVLKWPTHGACAAQRVCDSCLVVSGVPRGDSVSACF